MPFKNSKSYGVLHIENYFSFLGFAKKVNSDEIQKVDIYLDDVLIDTITADKHLQKIEDIYELEGFGFEYILPNKYVGKKSIISFKNHETNEDLQNSPYTLIDETHPEFNEIAFLNNIELTVNEEKILNSHCPNSIGFLAIEENLNNEEFIKLMNILFERNYDIRYKAFYFTNEQKTNTLKIFNKFSYKIDFIIPVDLYDITNNISIYIHSFVQLKNIKTESYHKIWQVLNEVKINLFLIYLFDKIEDINNFSNNLNLIDCSKIEFEKSIVSQIFKDDKRYDEFKFMNSLNQPINDELKKMYKPNTIGFLATKDNLEDKEFMEYIQELMERFPNNDFNGFYFNTSINESDFNLINKNIKLIKTSVISDLIPQIQVFVSNTKTPLLSEKLHKIIQLETNNIYFTNYTNDEVYHKKLKDVDLEFIRKILIKNIEIFGLNLKELNTKNLYEIIHKRNCSNTNIVYEPIDINNTPRHTYSYYIVIKLALMSNSYIKNIKNFERKIYKLKDK